MADVKSLVIHPATTTHSQLSEEGTLLDVGIKPNTIRLSIGTEHIDEYHRGSGAGVPGCKVTHSSLCTGIAEKSVIGSFFRRS